MKKNNKTEKLLREENVRRFMELAKIKGSQKFLKEAFEDDELGADDSASELDGTESDVPPMDDMSDAPEGGGLGDGLGDEGSDKVEFAGDVEKVISAMLDALSDTVAGLELDVEDDGVSDLETDESMGMDDEVPELTDDEPEFGADSTPDASLEDDDEFPMEGLKVSKRKLIEQVRENVKRRLKENAQREAKAKQRRASKKK